MIFDKYEEKKGNIEFTYQVSAIHCFAFLHKMYNLELSDDNKDLLVGALVGKFPEDGSILTEIPSLIFMLHLL